jgi:CheY-like chemotaxis protein
MTVLLVDDDNDDIGLFKEALELIDRSIIFLTAYNGHEALAILESDLAPPDHIFLDINMPLMSGLECLVEIRKRFPNLSSAITIYSTSKSFSNYNEAAKLGAGYIIKPDQYQKLKELLIRRLSECSLQ